MAAHGAGHPFDADERRRYEVAGVEGAAVVEFGTGMDLDEGLDGGEPWLARIAPVGYDPIDIAGGHIGAGLDAAMALLDGGFHLEFDGRRGVEVVFGIGFERRLVTPEGEH